MAKTEPRTLPGFMELLPSEQILFDQMRKNNRRFIQNFWIFTNRHTNHRIIRSIACKKLVVKQKNKFIDLIKGIQIYH